MFFFVEQLYQIYLKDDVMTFSVEPNRTIKEFLTTYTFDRKYNLIMSFATLCFVAKSDWKKFITLAKENTNSGGIHIMHIFTDAVPASPDIAPFAIGLAKDGEIKEIYNDCIKEPNSVFRK